MIWKKKVNKTDCICDAKRRLPMEGAIYQMSKRITRDMKAMRLATMPATRVIASVAPTEKASKIFPYGLSAFISDISWKVFSKDFTLEKEVIYQMNPLLPHTLQRSSSVFSIRRYFQNSWDLTWQEASSPHLKCGFRLGFWVQETLSHFLPSLPPKPNLPTARLV